MCCEVNQVDGDVFVDDGDDVDVPLTFRLSWVNEPTKTNVTASGLFIYRRDLYYIAVYISVFLKNEHIYRKTLKYQ